MMMRVCERWVAVELYGEAWNKVRALT